MRKNALITLNMIEYATIHLKDSAEYARILNISDAAHSISSLYKSLSSNREQCQTFKKGAFCKRIMA